LRLSKLKPNALYNLDKDISEKKNVIKNHPEIVSSLLKAAQDFEKEISANIRPAAFVDDPKSLSMSEK